MMNTLQFTSIALTIILLSIVGIKLYLKFSRRFCTSRRRLDGKVAIVTGANTGIGLETAKDLARRGAKVILACRDLKKAEAAADEIRRETRNRNVHIRKLNLSSPSQVRFFCSQILKEESRLDILVNNAAVAYAEKVTTEDGLEGHLVTNHLGPFLLTNMLLGLMIKSGPSRIINVSSSAHKMAKTVDLENLNSDQVYEPKLIYGKTKLYNILFTVELHRRLQAAGLINKVTVNALHPGVVKTELFRHAKKIRIYKYIIGFLEMFFMTAYEGAQTSIQLAVSEEMDGISGLYWAACRNALTNKLAEDETLAKDLWDASAKLIKLQPNEYHLPI